MAELGAPEGSGAATSDEQFKKARAASESFKAQEAQVRLKRLKGELVDRAAAEAHVRELAAEERGAFEEFVQRKAPEMAARLAVDADEMESVLSEFLREHLLERAGVKVDLSS